MMMPRLTPDKLNGKTILRPVIPAGPGNPIPKLASSSVFHPPTVVVEYPVLPVDEIAEMAAKNISQGGVCTLSRLAALCKHWLSRMAVNERKRCIAELKANGFELAAGALERRNYQPE